MRRKEDESTQGERARGKQLDMSDCQRDCPLPESSVPPPRRNEQPCAGENEEPPKHGEQFGEFHSLGEGDDRHARQKAKQLLAVLCAG